MQALLVSRDPPSAFADVENGPKPATSNTSCENQLFGGWDAFWGGWFLNGCPKPDREAGVPRQLQGPGAQQNEVRGRELESAVISIAAQICLANQLAELLGDQRTPGLMSGWEAVLGKALGWGSSSHRCGPTYVPCQQKPALAVEVGCREGGVSFSILPAS